MWHKRTPSRETPPSAPKHAADVARAYSGGLALGGAAAKEQAMDPEVAAFDRLRAATYERMGREIADRLANNPVPTYQERIMGTYVEALEPQVRNAVMTMRAKGYGTGSSGFHNANGNWRVLGIDNPARTYDAVNRRGQVMSFNPPFSLDAETARRLTDIGAEMFEWPEVPGVRTLGFTPDSPDIEAITAQWDRIASVLPDTGAPIGLQTETLEARGFRVYCPPDIEYGPPGVRWPVEGFNAIATEAAANFDMSVGLDVVPGEEA